MVRLLDKGLSDKSELKFLLTWVYYLHFRNNTNIKETSTSNSLQTERIRGPSKCPTTIRCHLVWWFTWIPTITHNQVGLIFYCSYLFTFFFKMIIFLVPTGNYYVLWNMLACFHYFLLFIFSHQNLQWENSPENLSWNSFLNPHHTFSFYFCLL